MTEHIVSSRDGSGPEPPSTWEQALDGLRDEALLELEDVSRRASALSLPSRVGRDSLTFETCPSCGERGAMVVTAYLWADDPEEGEAEPRWSLLKVVHESGRDGECTIDDLARVLTEEPADMHPLAVAASREVDYLEWLTGQPEPSDRVPDDLGEPDTDEHGLVSLLDLAKRPAPEWIVEGVVPGGPRLVELSGPAGTGKSYLALALGLSGVAGREWIGHEVKRLRTLYLPMEGDYEVAPRSRAWCEAHGLTLEDVADGFKILPAQRLSGDEDIVRLGEAIEGHGADLVIIDAWRQALGGKSDSDEEAVSTLLSRLRMVAAVTGTTFLILHNTGWAGGRERGSTYLRDDVDLVMRADPIDDESFNLVCDKSRLAPKFTPKGVVLVDQDGKAVAKRFRAAEESDLSAEQRARAAILEALTSAGAAGMTKTDMRRLDGVSNPRYVAPVIDALRDDGLIEGGEARGEAVRLVL